MSLKPIKYGDTKYYAVHENKDIPEEIKEKLIKGLVKFSFYSSPYLHYKINK